jgi:hypothetical protein
MIRFVTAFSVLALSVAAQADCGKCGPGEKCSSATCSAAKCDAGKGCPITAAMKQLPKLTYAVGEKKACCQEAAAKLAKESSGHIHFVVGKKEFDSESDAQMALIEATEKFVADYTKPHTCPESGKLTLAGQGQSCEKTAAHTADLMQKAMAKVKFTYLVGDKECSCPLQAGQLAKESGKEKLFVVGEEKTCCEKTARLNLARAKYKAAITAMVEAQAAAEKPSPTDET